MATDVKTTMSVAEQRQLLVQELRRLPRRKKFGIEKVKVRIELLRLLQNLPDEEPKADGEVDDSPGAVARRKLIASVTKGSKR